jgi:hypothetical protein
MLLFLPLYTPSKSAIILAGKYEYMFGRQRCSVHNRMNRHPGFSDADMDTQSNVQTYKKCIKECYLKAN